MKKIIAFLRSTYHFVLAFTGNVLFGFPSRKMFVIGITGTKGKSSTIEFLDFVLTKAGKKTAVLSSAKKKILGSEESNSSGNTMPGRFQIQEFLRKAVRSGAEYAIVEVTSQGVLQWRDRFINWDAGFFMNLHPEHIESHGSFENYRSAKVRFFKDVLKSKKHKKYFFVNSDDENYSYFCQAVENNEGAEVFYFNKESFIKRAEGWGWNVKEAKDRGLISDWLLPEFNLYNSSAVLSFADVIGIPEETEKEALREFGGLRGRFDFVQKDPFTVVVDYAHTPDSLEKIYSSLRESFLVSGRNKMICILGSAGGGRDKWKRSVMGEKAGRYCDEIILTDEDPYDEDPEEILNQIEGGLKDYRGKVFKILDRREAIRKALSDAKEGDVVVGTGKGSETSIHLASGRKIPWNEKEIMRGMLMELFHSGKEA